MSHWELGELQHLSRSADHLGSLANVLKDLGGDETILHELTQNADDAHGATKIRFSIGAEALTVWNDGVFSNCDHQEKKQCPWRSERGRSCDLHSFRLFSGRHKSGDASTTGAFGVGFTCVYHLTDHPELVTAGTHLLLDEGAAEDHRIRVCKVETCPRDHQASGTTFVLPWARHRSSLREELEVEAIDDARIARLCATFIREASATLLFLKRVATIEVTSGSEVTTVSREVEDDVVRIISENHLDEWLLLEGEYDTSEGLKRRYRDINPNRNALVQVAIHVGEPVPGRFYAGLPSQMSTGWSGHVNGSFYPRTDRKSFEFSDDTYRSEWNLDLLDSAAHLVAENLERVAQMTGVSAPWEILRDLQQVARDVNDGKLPQGFEQVFDKVADAAVRSSILRVVDGSLTVPTGALLPMEVAHYASAHVVHNLGLSVVHPELRSLVFETEYTKYGINQLTARRLIEHLAGDGHLTEAWAAEENILEDNDADLLLELLESLLGRSGSWREEAETSQIAVIPCCGARYAPARDAVLVEDDALRRLFIRVDPELHIVDLDRLAAKSPTMLGLVDGLDLMTGLQSLCNSTDPALLSENAELLVAWFEAHRSSLESNEAARDQVRSLPVFPSSVGGYDSLENLSVPSNFEDLFGVANLIDADFAQIHWSLLQALGAQELSAVEYLTKHLLPRLPELTPDAQDLEFVLDLVYNARPSLDEAHWETEALRSAPLVTCTDGLARSGCQVHTPNAVVTLIDPETPIANLAAISEYLHDTVVWLGASTRPSEFLVNEAARRLAEDTSAPSPKVCVAILEAIRDASGQFASVPIGLANLRDLAWLPVEGGGKGKPTDLYPVFQSYLFESQGPKLGLPRDSQIQHSEALNWLGMPTEPTVPMVVAHLQHCATAGEPMNNEVYVWLGRHVDSSAVTPLSDHAVIQTSPGVFVHARQAFWQPTQLGRWASQLPHEMRRYQGFMDAIGVAEEPTAGDLDFILKLIASEVGTNPLDPEDELVVHECWSILDNLVNAEPGTTRILQIIGRRPSFPDRRRILAKPEHLIFRDPRRLADHIALIVNEVIDRERRTQHGLECAGVTRAEDVIAVEPVDVVSTQDEDLMALVSERHVALMRAVESVATARPELDIQAGLIPDLDFHRATTLNVVYRAAVGSQQFATPPQSIDAMFFEDEFRVVHTSSTTKIPVAREISRAIAPYLDPSELAPLIVTVLDASSAEDAMHRLDDYGVASVVDVDRETVASTIAVDVVAEREGDDRSSDEDAPAELQPRSIDDQPQADLPVGTAVSDTDDDDLEDQDAHSEAIREDAGSRPADMLLSAYDSGAGAAPGTDGTRRSDRNHSSGGASVGMQRSGAAGSASRMRSYVLVGDDSAYGATGDESHDSLEIDRAGVDRVLAHESAHGREPEEQGHTNPGFDVLSSDKDGKIVRRIEIKSIRGAWTIRGVMMSARQFREATEYGQQFWLYIVENAQDDELCRIHRIQDPATRIDFFGFDNGWEVLREPDFELTAQGRPAARSTRALLGLSPGGEDRDF
jgi:hypothetical protein